MERQFTRVTVSTFLALTALACSASFLVAVPAAAGEWQPVGRMTERRWDFTATLLLDGTVLVTGGRGPNSDALRTAEQFDPKTNSFTAVGRMSVGRAHLHKAVLLQDGRVLVLGDETRAADLFDPATNTFTPVGSTLTDRWGNSATRLANGQVLVAGAGSADSQKRAELFDPKTRTFQYTGDLSSERFLASAVALPDGRVALIGGFTDHTENPQLSSVEIYDPATGAFTPHGQLVLARQGPDGVLLPDGRILVSGGVAGPFTALVTLRDEIYDPATGQSVFAYPEATSKTRPLWGVAIPLQDGRILLAGGTWRYGVELRDSDFVQSAELFDPQTGKLTPTAPMLQPRFGPAAVRLTDGRVLVMGGRSPLPEAILRTAEVYVP